MSSTVKRIYVEKFQVTASRNIALYTVPDVDHFDEINVLADPESLLFQKICAMIGL